MIGPLEVKSDDRPEAYPTRWPDPVMNFLIAYDIADPRRLRPVAQSLERHGRRVQKSVFIFTGSRRDLDGVLAEVLQHLDVAADRVQAWPIRTSTLACRVDLGTGHADRAVAAIDTAEQLILIEAIDEPGGRDHEPLMIN